MGMNKVSHPVLYLEVSGLGLASSVEVGRFVSPGSRGGRGRPGGNRNPTAGETRGVEVQVLSAQARPCSDRAVAAVVAVDGGSSVSVSQ
jgi:hypothetical protein